MNISLRAALRAAPAPGAPCTPPPGRPPPVGTLPAPATASAAAAVGSGRVDPPVFSTPAPRLRFPLTPPAPEASLPEVGRGADAMPALRPKDLFAPPPTWGRAALPPLERTAAAAPRAPRTQNSSSGLPLPSAPLSPSQSPSLASASLARTDRVARTALPALPLR
eukprot:scaffold13991_cov108-Isochrysis_galbana.AAC.1